MKTLKFYNANKAINVDYLVDLIGDAQPLAVYNITQNVLGVPQVGLNGEAIAEKFFDKIDKTVGNEGRDHTPYTLKEFTQFAIDHNFSLLIVEESEVLNTLTALGFVTESFDGGTSGTPYSMQLESEGGNAPYIFTTESTLPAGITLSEDGLLEGTPTEDGTFPLEVTVTDKFGVTSVLSEDLVIAAA